MKLSKAYELDEGLAVIKQKIEEIRKAAKTLVVGIAGGSGSGKTTKVAKKIQDSFPGSAILSMDDYFRGREFMKSIDSENWDEPRVFDLNLLVWHLHLLKAGLPIQKPVYSFSSGAREGYELFKPAGLIILEGLFTLCEPVIDKIDLKIFVDISVHGSLIRRLTRDVGRTGQTECDIFRQYMETVYPMYKIHIEPTKSQADIIIINQYVPEIEAESCQIQEMQVKALMEHELSLTDLEKLGFRKSSASFQQDTYYSAPGWRPPYRAELMRIREEQGRYFLAYKGPLHKGLLLRIKPKIEFEVDPALSGALERLGYEKLLSFGKKRQKFSGSNNLELVIDDIEGYGRFLEFRAKDKGGEVKIYELLKKLGIRKKKITRKSYLEILLSKKTSA